MDGLNREINDFDLIIKNGTLVDGTGSKSKPGNIAIKNGIIEALGNCRLYAIKGSYTARFV